MSLWKQLFSGDSKPKFPPATLIEYLVNLSGNGELEINGERKPLTEAERKKAVEGLLTEGADVNAKNSSGTTALCAASYFGHCEIVQALLAKGANINAKENLHGTTALMQASLQGQKKVVELLLAKGADVNAKMNNGDTAMMIASTPEIKELLIRAGAK